MVYQIKNDGVAYAVADEMKTPFAVVTFFRNERSLRLSGRTTYQELQQQLNQQIPIQNLPYATSSLSPSRMLRRQPRPQHFSNRPRLSNTAIGVIGASPSKISLKLPTP